MRQSCLVRTLKRSRTVHSSYKLLRLLPEASVSEWMRLRRTWEIFRVLPNTMLSAARLFNAHDCMEEVESKQLDGAVVECGVWAGGAIGLMAHVNKRIGKHGREFHLFDSFEGLPQPSPHDAEVVDRFREQHPDMEPDHGAGSTLNAIGACAAPLEAVKELFFKVLKIDPQSVVIHKGWFQDTVPKAKDEIGPISILRLDGDWYESTKICLENLYDNVVHDGFVIIDDFGAFAGCRKAVIEFFESRKIEPEYIPIDDVGVFLRKSG